jgi:large subunit ribosomal protein L21
MVDTPTFNEVQLITIYKKNSIGGRNMYAIVRTGGKQYQVAAGDTLRVEKLQGEVGDTVEFSDVLLVADGENIRIGTPAVEGAKVVAKIVEQGKAKKVLVFKKKKRKGYRVLRGHRQLFTALSIQEIM